MGKSSRKKTTQQPKRQSKPKVVQSKWQKVVQACQKTPKLMVGIISFLIGLAGFAALVYPRISITPGVSLELHNPYKTPFIIKNDGYLPLHDISYSLTADKMELISGGTFIDSGGSMGNTVSKLSPNKSSALFVDRIFSMPPNLVKYARVTIAVTYKPYLVPFTFTESVKFKTEVNINKEYVWYESYEEL